MVDEESSHDNVTTSSITTAYLDLDLLPKTLNIRVGRQYINDPREWLFAEGLDAIRTIYRTSSYQLDAFVGREDLFPDDFYLERVNRVYKDQLAHAGVKTIALLGTDQLCKRVARALKDHDIDFNKGSIAKILRADLTRMQNADALPNETRTKARSLIAAINDALSHETKPTQKPKKARKLKKR